MIARDLRALNNFAFLYRERTRFRCGASDLLGVVLEPENGEGIIVDARELPELRRIDVRPDGAARIGAFAAFDEVAGAVPAIAPPGATVRNVRLRMALGDARVEVFGIGRTRYAQLDALALAPHEVPVTIEVAAPRKGLGIAERRRTTRDGDASHTVGVTAALRVSALARFEHVRVFLDVDGEVQRAAEVEAKLEKQRCSPEAIPEAARMAAAGIKTIDARSSAVARSLQPLVLAALREAFEAAKAA